MQVAIIGAGIAGLTLADRLSAQGVSTVLIEREETVGGLARSFTYDNGVTFDIGPHRFHTDDTRVQEYVEEVLAEDVILIDRNSQLFLFNKYIPWPITLSSVLALPPHLLIRSALDLVRPRKARTESFEDYIIERYGRTLYKVFFQPYTEKFLNYTCENLHKDWATTGISRATIDNKLDTSSLFGVAKSVLMGAGDDPKFIYPESGGIGVFPDKLAARIVSRGGRILLSSQVDRFEREKGAATSVITDSGEVIPVDHVFWSGSLESLRDVGNAPDSVPRVHYMSTILFNYVTTHPIDQGFQWCYFGDGDMEVDRICVPRNFNPKLAPAGKEGLCIEICSSETCDAWKDPTRLDCVVETFLLKARLLEGLDSVEDYHIERIHDTYPLYVLNYPRKLRALFDWIHGTWRNMTLVGRTGRFWYNNMDHSIAASLATADRFLEDYEKGVLRAGDVYSAEDRYLTG
ncbi:MAG: NAD(P)-binding protein [bacterium]|nr:NAD(P)-binding protein [bacterium]